MQRDAGMKGQRAQGWRSATLQPRDGGMLEGYRAIGYKAPRRRMQGRKVKDMPPWEAG